MRSARRDHPVVITDAAPSFDDDQRHRKRVYAALMVLHLVGFVAAGLLANVWWLALVIIALTGALPWIAVVIANDRGRTDRSAPRYHAGRRQLPPPR
ncbi:MAG: DUF3099 domain-containing protein [Saccharopolyspora rectivirgula]|jgi:fatty acid desaturase|uniref:DUF3099 domain-containing protein n=1 Tax=Saccharopolyspora rectivirgula TaxID=28042 RepID=UPI00240A891D|nr:DUF3099 domain-containing protein [Saccharopolyspora rectivirgula]